eukprot:TRINITY_DN1362_c0_g1_i7.p1 TRINITY_DN1362_c0_g1~~TRINITY_DN1362_c0_g1_i7.p1  ORF type:complete len:404 (+),score=60.71 TRINITY_DN1362_c0_g1_i7:1062-2273(+)
MAASVSTGRSLIAILVAGSISCQAQPMSGQEDSDACPVLTTCDSNYHDNSLLVWSQGRFTGKMTTNLCPAHDGLRGRPDPQCITQTFPAPDYDGVGPFHKVRGRIGLTMNGVNIYGPLEAGFEDSCANVEGGHCVPGLDVVTCEKSLIHICGGEDQVTPQFLDACGGHAKTYHYHGDIACDYDHMATGHSPIVGIALDGIPIYGLNEDTDTFPTDLDACGGHVGPVPADDRYGIEAGNYYHYHVSLKDPYTLGCFAGQQQHVSIETCKQTSRYCGEGYVTVFDEFGGEFCYDDDCTCYDTDGRNNYLSSDCSTTPVDCSHHTTRGDCTSATCLGSTTSCTWSRNSGTCSCDDVAETSEPTPQPTPQPPVAEDCATFTTRRSCRAAICPGTSSPCVWQNRACSC